MNTSPDPVAAAQALADEVARQQQALQHLADNDRAAAAWSAANPPAPQPTTTGSHS
ncbi:hypothetical protein [Kitasatospora cineracea]|uniref:Uncharacterized protein n=1 Tax=Kitasatospora cineracea TaxID=88074 RepID=A0A3N4R7L8_9ACTN|nr:hypothetical protein [Kitasatospora cineracea]RPE26611.1 hypothetical protein EDD38_7672 [Kitasatospora cineracea]